MADISLDQYIAKSQGNRTMRGGMGARLGPKSPRGGMARGRGGVGARIGGRGRGMAQQGGTQPHFNVVGLGKVKTFDARQRLSNPLKTAVQDARQMIRSKNFDARQTLQTKKSLDVRSKIETSKAKKIDARQKINIARQAKGQSKELSGPILTGPGGAQGAAKQGQGVVSMYEGSLTKTIRSAPAPKQQVVRNSNSGRDKIVSLTRTVDNSTSSRRPPSPIVHGHVSVRSQPPTRSQPVMRSQPVTRSQPVMRSQQVVRSQPSSRPQSGGRSSQSLSSSNLVITKRNPALSRPSTASSQGSPRTTISLRGIRSASSDQWSGTESTLRSASSAGTVVSVENDIYCDDYNDGGSGSVARMSPYERGPARPQQSQSVQAGAVWDAIQSVTSKRSQEPSQQMTMTDTVSPLQGYRVLVTNLHPIVTQDDIVELFGAVGALKKARLIKPGTAEVVFVTREEAMAAVRKYHLRELDGLPMQLVLTTRGAPQDPSPLKSANSSQPEAGSQAQPPSGGPLRLGHSDINNGKQSSVSVDPTLIHRALFKTVSREEPPSRPVTFTVKI